MADDDDDKEEEEEEAVASGNGEGSDVMVLTSVVVSNFLMRVVEC